MIQILCLHNHVEDFVPLSFMDSSDPQGTYQIALSKMEVVAVSTAFYAWFPQYMKACFFDNKLCVRHNSAQFLCIGIFFGLSLCHLATQKNNPDSYKEKGFL